MRANKEYRLSLTEQAQKIVDQLSLEEKVFLMSGSIVDLNRTPPEKIAQMMGGMLSDDNHYNVTPYPAGGLPEHNIPPMLFVDGPRGVVCGTGKSTCFPVSMARGATFSPELEEKVGHCIGKEVRAFGGNLFAGVCINLPYTPAGAAARKPTVKNPSTSARWAQRWCAACRTRTSWPA